MDLLPLITDNVAELLVMIVEFTQARQKVLLQNISNMSAPGFMPQDLSVDEFSELLKTAIAQHVQTRRLILCDTETIKFDPTGRLKIKPIVDQHARTLLGINPDSFLELQISKLMENSLNQRVAAELLRERRAADEFDS